jgi:predicted ester cyclase
MSTKEPLLRLQQAASTGDAELVARTIDEVVAPDALIRTPAPIGATGAQLLKEVFLHLLRAFPDLHIETEDVITEGDKAVYRNTVTGTHRGEYLGIAPTGRRISYAEIFIVRVADGRIVETWGVVDVAAQLRQLGVLPPIGR